MKKAIVIGTGVGGAAVSALLARKGFAVTVFERSGFEGGKAASYERDGFVCDMGIHFTARGSNGPLGEVARRVGADLRFSEPNPVMRIVTPSRSYDLPQSLLSPLALIKQFMVAGVKLRNLPGALRLFMQILRIKEESDAVPHDSVSMRDFLLRYTDDEGFQRLLSIFNMLMFVIPTEEASAGEFLWSFASMAKTGSLGYPLGGFGQIAKSYLRACERNGGEIRLKEGVRSIRVENGKAVGVETDKGVYEADLVVSNAGIRKTIEMAGEDRFPATYTARAKELRDSLGAVTIKYALDRRPFDIPTVVYMPEDMDWSRNMEMMSRGEAPEEVPIFLPCPTFCDPSLAPPGKHILLAGTAVPADLSASDREAHHLEAPYEPLLHRRDGRPRGRRGDRPCPVVRPGGGEQARPAHARGGALPGGLRRRGPWRRHRTGRRQRAQGKRADPNGGAGPPDDHCRSAGSPVRGCRKSAESGISGSPNTRSAKANDCQQKRKYAMEATTSTTEGVLRQEREPFEKRLADIVGGRHVLDSPEELSRYFAGAVDTGGLVAVQPGSTEEVQGVVRTANELGLPVYTLNDRYLRPADAGPKGVVLDFCRMTAIEKLDKRNLLVHAQRGLTFEALQKELDAQDLKIASPLAATSESVLCNFVNRAPHKKATVYAEPHVYNMQVVLADGSLFRTGSHSLNEMNNCREDGGPSLSRWYIASDDIFGVVTRATVWLYPKTECRDALLFGFDRLEDVVAALRNGPRTELGWEYLAADRRFLASLLETDAAGLPPWTLVVGFDAQKRLVEYQQKKVLAMMANLGGDRNDAHREEMAVLLDRVWYQASPLHTGFYAACNRVKELDDLAREQLSGAGVSPAGTAFFP